MWISACLTLFLLGTNPASAEPDGGTATTRLTEAQFNQLREQARNRARRIIFNNDGNEPVYLCKTTSPEELLGYRTRPLAGTQVDSIFYCTWSSGFGMFTHLTKAGQVFTTQEGWFSSNRMPEFLEKGVDPLRVMTEFARTNGLEIFWSMRMNDTHDASLQDYGPIMFRANRLKMEHPEYLVGTKESRPKYGTWSAVDYGRPEIRDLAFRYCEEVARDYDVNGIELDFFRHAFFFKCSGRGEPCGETELEQMSDLVRRIRRMLDKVGRKKGAPILLAVRVPDSVEYCRVIGLDLERWLAEGLIDLLIVSGYTQLNPWEYSVQLARKHGVKVYPSLDEPRVRSEDANKLRMSVEAHRGRALTAWAAGVDGIYIFNYFRPLSPIWRELGDPAKLRRLERHHFVSVRGVARMPVPHHKFLHVPVLDPTAPITITNLPVQIRFTVGEPDSQVNATLRLEFKHPSGVTKLGFEFNGHELKPKNAEGERLEFQLRPGMLRRGENVLEIAPPGANKFKVLLNDLLLTVKSAL